MDPVGWDGMVFGKLICCEYIVFVGIAEANQWPFCCEDKLEKKKYWQKE